MMQPLIVALKSVRILLWVTVIAAHTALGLHVSAEPGVMVQHQKSLAEDASGRPNVILILADDLGYGDLQCYGHPRFRTPHLDKMAADGVRFTQFNTPAPFCAPTRASLMTGKYPVRCGMPMNPAPDATPAINEIHLPEHQKTLAETLRSAGYATAIFGKWHLGHARTEWLPTHRGFDEYFGIPYSNDMRPVALYEGDQKVEEPVEQSMLTERLTQRALSFIDRNHQRPFFLYLAHAMPHKPLAVSSEWAGKSGAGLYGDVIGELDSSVGQIVSRLTELGIERNTLVIFTSDNGAWYGGSTGGLRGMKSRSYEGAYRVPCIVRWPGTIPPGQTVTQPAVTMDLHATILEATGIPRTSDQKTDGISLLPLMKNQARLPERVIFGQQRDEIATVRNSRWKLHVLAPNGVHAVTTDPTIWKDPRGPDGTTILAPREQHTPKDHPGVVTGADPKAMQLFDLQVDPSEQQDVAAKHPEIAASLKQDYDRFQVDWKSQLTSAGIPSSDDRDKISGQSEPSAKSPNVVIFLADDLGYGDLGCYGHPLIQTPHLDAFAAQGIRLTQCYSASAVCSPSRSAILTGRTPYRNGVFTWIPEGRDLYLRTSEITLPTILRNEGYATCHVGKWHLNSHFNQPSQPQPSDHGYDWWLATQNNAAPSHEFPENFVRNGKPVGKIDDYSAQFVVQEAISWLKNHRDPEKPFFLTVWTHEPHYPIRSAPRFRDMYPNVTDDVQKEHHANVTQLDDAFGVLMKTLDEMKLADDTFVMFTSDNGPEGDGVKTPGRGSTGGLRGRKRAVYEGGIRVPGVIRWPGRIRPGSESRQPVIGSDLFVTATSIAGGKLPSDRVIDGGDLRAILTDSPVERARPLYWRCVIAPEPLKTAMRIGDWKILSDEALTQFELYNLEKDPTESHDLRQSEPVRFEEMKNRLKSLNAEIEAEGPSWWKDYPAP
jgi:arylsulfatase A